MVMLKVLFGAALASLGGAIAFFALAPDLPSRGTHWHAVGCPGQGNLVYHADYIDEFPEGCKEFVLVDNRTDKKVTSIWADEIRNATR